MTEEIASSLRTNDPNERFASRDRLPPNDFPSPILDSNRQSLANRLAEIVDQIDEACRYWRNDVITVDVPADIYRHQADQQTFIWNRFLVPGGQLLLAAHYRNAFQSNQRIENFLAQWTPNAIRSRGFSQIGNGCYPVAGDNWTCGKIAEEFVQFYCLKIEKKLFDSNEPVAIARRIRHVFQAIAAHLQSLAIPDDT